MDENRQNLLFGKELWIKQIDGCISCFRCGLCCIGSHIHLTLGEARHISENVGVSWPEFEEMYIDPMWLGGDRYILRQSGGACIFLKQEEGRCKGSCLIHPFRPFSCVSFTPSLFRRQCQAGMIKYWGITVSHSARLQGSEEKLRDFYSLYSSILGETTTAMNYLLE